MNKLPQSEWKPRLVPGQSMPEAVDDWFGLACSSVYADSGIQAHLPYLREIVSYNGFPESVVELGTGGGDQSTLAWLAARASSIDTYDANEPSSLPILRYLAEQTGTRFSFHKGNTNVASAPEHRYGILFVDTLHDATTVETELRRFAPNCTGRIIFHDVLTFGRVGQFGGPNQGINNAIAEFLFDHPEWTVERYDKADNGLLTLTKRL